MSKHECGAACACGSTPKTNSPTKGQQGGGPRIADIFRQHGREYLKRHPTSGEQARAIRDISRCRTEEMGGNRRTCPECGFSDIHYNSCGNRHCPTCQGLSGLKWMAERQARMLPVAHFLVTFTLPEELRAIALQNVWVFFKLMFRATAQTIEILGRQRYGVLMGVTAILHTWSRVLMLHPHIHLLVTAGGLTEEGKWVATPQDFLFPFRQLKAVYRMQMIQGLFRLYDKGKLKLEGTQAHLRERKAFKRLVKKLWKQTWVADVQSPRGRPEHAVRYLAQYTHKVAISDHRLLSFSDGKVSFRVRDDKTMTLGWEEFIRRYLLHVLPRGFHKTRHFGLYAGRRKETLEKARQAAPQVPAPTHAAEGQGGSVMDFLSAVREAKGWAEIVLAVTGVDPRCCPECGCLLRINRFEQPSRNLRGFKVSPQAVGDTS